MKNLFYGFLFLTLNWNALAQNINPVLAIKLQNKLDEMVSQNQNTKGVSAGVFIPGQGIWTGASGVSFAGQPLTSDMKLGLASNSKLFVAVVMLVLSEKNILSLDDKLSKWLPTYKNIDPNITLRQLLNHTSGVEDMFTTQAHLDSINKNPFRKWKPEEVLSWIGPKKFAPGAGYYYSNTNYILAGMIAEKATGKHISILIREYILTPLQMNDTYYDVEEAIPGTIAHRWFNSKDYHDTSRISLNSAGGAAGSLFSTPADMLNWYSKLLNGEIVNANSLAQMTDFKSPGNYGLGISKYFLNVLNKTVWGHGGRTFGYRTRMIYDPCMKVIACGLSNSDPSGVDGITASLYQVVIDHIPACAGSISGNAVVCQGQNSIIYSVPSIPNATSYIWTLPNGFMGTSITNSITINVEKTAVSGKITVVGKNIYGDGTASVFNITVNPMPIANITTDGSFGLCIGGSVNLIANAGSSYSWSTGETTKTITINNAGSYSLTVTNEFGCKSIPATVQIQEIKIPNVPATITGNAYANCQKTSLYKINKVSNASSYTWTTDIPGALIVKIPNSSDTAVNITFPIFSNGSLQVNAVNACGSSLAKKLSLFGHPAASVKIFGKETPCVGTIQYYYTEKIAGATKYNWTVPQGTSILSGANTQVIKVLIGSLGGDITVQAENACGAGLVLKKTINTPCLGQLVSNNYELSLYPNPFHDNIILRLNSSFTGESIIQILDLQGKSIWSKNYLIYKGSNKFSLDLSNFNSGLYTLIISTPESIQNIRIVKD